MAVNTEEHTKEYYTLKELSEELGVHRNTLLYRSGRMAIPTHQFQLDRNIYFTAEDAQTLRNQWQERIERSVLPGTRRKTGADAKNSPRTGKTDS